jgi:hypothetical protein
MTDERPFDYPGSPQGDVLGLDAGLTRREALATVLELAEQNALDPELYRGEEELEAQAEEQQEAIGIVQVMLDGDDLTVPDPPEGDWMPDTVIAQIEKCGFECQGGPLENNVAWRWMKNTMLGLQRITDEVADA